jgi:ElaB/YqjD/DUF883 family membrane-anchored ribosome-binding protein
MAYVAGSTHVRKSGNGHDARRNSRSIKSALRKMTREAKHLAEDTMAHYYDDIRGKSTEARRNVSEYIEKRPFRSLGIAMLAGIVLGFFLRRK